MTNTATFARLNVLALSGNSEGVDREIFNGASGIPREGREAEYATQMWLDDPTAFFLHPEGPLSDKTPDEWREEQRALARRVVSQRPPSTAIQGQLASISMLQHASSQQSLNALWNGVGAMGIPQYNAMLAMQQRVR